MNVLNLLQIKVVKEEGGKNPTSYNPGYLALFKVKLRFAITISYQKF